MRRHSPGFLSQTTQPATRTLTRDFCPLICDLAASLGLEPRQGDPESPVLPLHHEATQMRGENLETAGRSASVGSTRTKIRNPNIETRNNSQSLRSSGKQTGGKLQHVSSVLDLLILGFVSR